MNKEFYIKSRERVANLLPDNSALILFAGKDIRESEDQSYEFCVNRNFYYLTGVNEQNDIFVMIKENPQQSPLEDVRKSLLCELAFRGRTVSLVWKLIVDVGEGCNSLYRSSLGNK